MPPVSVHWDVPDFDDELDGEFSLSAFESRATSKESTQVQSDEHQHQANGHRQQVPVLPDVNAAAATPISDYILDIPDTDDELDDDFVSSAFESRATSQESLQVSGESGPQQPSSSSGQQQMAAPPMGAFMVMVPAQFLTGGVLAVPVGFACVVPIGSVPAPSVQPAPSAQLGGHHEPTATAHPAQPPGSWVADGAAKVAPVGGVPTATMQAKGQAPTSEAHPAQPPGSWAATGKPSAPGGVATKAAPGGGAPASSAQLGGRHDPSPTAHPAQPPGSWGVTDAGSGAGDVADPAPIGSVKMPPRSQRGGCHELPANAHPAQLPGSWGVKSVHPSPPTSIDCNGVRFLSPTRRLSELSQGRGGVLTTLTINHIPIDFSKKQLLELLDATGFKGRYDYFFLPFNCKERTNRGHAFVNFRTALDAKSFFAAWHGAQLSSSGGNSEGSRLSVSVCAVQGFEDCTKRWTATRLRLACDLDVGPFILGHAGQYQPGPEAKRM